MATSKRKTASERVTNAAAEPLPAARTTATNGAAALTVTISTTGLRRNVNSSPLGMLRLTEVLVQAVVAGMLTAFGRVSAFSERANPYA